uniref:Uncharacterized protein n=1 Tax=Rhizophora mucronata TaxID=61149 RepID=A0A2P2QWL7_RHIMU
MWLVAWYLHYFSLSPTTKLCELVLFAAM